MLAAKNIDLRRIQSWMGHANIQTTMRHLHRVPQHDDAARTSAAFTTVQARTTPRRARFRDDASIDVPVAVAWGEEERLIPADARREDELPQHTKIVTPPGCGHVPFWDDPKAGARGDASCKPTKPLTRCRQANTRRIYAVEGVEWKGVGGSLTASRKRLVLPLPDVGRPGARRSGAAAWSAAQLPASQG
jgi:hypothetical protein